MWRASQILIKIYPDSQFAIRAFPVGRRNGPLPEIVNCAPGHQRCLSLVERTTFLFLMRDDCKRILVDRALLLFISATTVLLKQEFMAVDEEKLASFNFCC